MRAKTITSQNAQRVIAARRNGQNYRVTESDIGYVGHGEDLWDDSFWGSATDELLTAQSETRKSGYSFPERQKFDRLACRILHKTLDPIPPEIAASRGFWRWLASVPFYEIVEARHCSRQRPAGLANFGINGPFEMNRVYILWLRADIVYDEHAEDPYHIAGRLSSTDFWESGIIRRKCSWAPSLARAFVQFQYPDADSGRASLNLTDPMGVRMLYKRLQHLHTTVSFEHLSDEQIIPILEKKSSDLRQA